jgi:hypothetical protein
MFDVKGSRFISLFTATFENCLWYIFILKTLNTAIKELSLAVRVTPKIQMVLSVKIYD